MALPHNFTPGTTMGIAKGTWYRLKPEGGDHVVKDAVYLPVTDTVGFSQQHNWNEADNLGKNTMDALENVVKAIPVLGAGASIISRSAQHRYGGGPSYSACAVYMDSSPPTVSVRTKLFIPDGSGSIMKLLESFRADFTGGMKSDDALSKAVNSIAAAASSAGAVGRGGMITHPGWWTVDVVTFAGGGASVLMHMEDMIAKSMDVTMFAPFIKQDPSLVELTIGFGHGFRGLRESMSFGGGGGGGAGGGGSGASSSPQSTPNSRPSSGLSTNSTPSNASTDPRANRINLPAGLNSAGF